MTGWSCNYIWYIYNICHHPLNRKPINLESNSLPTKQSVPLEDSSPSFQQHDLCLNSVLFSLAKIYGQQPASWLSIFISYMFSSQSIYISTKVPNIIYWCVSQHIYQLYSEYSHDQHWIPNIICIYYQLWFEYSQMFQREIPSSTGWWF